MNNLKKRFDKYVGEAPRFTASLENRIMKEVSTLKKRNNRDKSSINLKLSLFFVVLISVATVFIMSVVTNSNSLNHANPITGPDPKSVIQKVLELQFNGVDKKLNEFLEPKYRFVKNGREELPEFEKYIDETYGPYFTEDGLEGFINNFGTTYPILAYEFGYQLNLKDVIIEQEETIPNRYNFTAKVGYQKDGSKEEIAEVNGIILFSTKEEGTIGKFQYGDDSGLASILNESVGDKETITFTEGIVYDTLCFSSREVVTDSYVESKNGCTSDMEQMMGILSRLDKLSTKDPSSEEEIERMEAIANISNYQIYLGQGKNFDNNVYTITVYEDGIIQYDDEGLPGIPQGDITIDAHTDKYNEIKISLEEFAE